MIDLILILLLMVSLFKPDVLISKKIKKKANEEQKKVLIKDARKIYASIIALCESGAIIRYNEVAGIILGIISLGFFVIVGWPARKEYSQITVELKD